MGSLMPIFFVVQGGVFLAWTILVFRFLFALRADAVSASGRTLPSMATQLRAFCGGMVEPRYRGQRARLALLTTLLVLMSAMSFVFFA